MDDRWFRLGDHGRYPARRLFLRRQLNYWSRICPDCQTEFSSVQARGICPNCELVFEVDKGGQLTRKMHRLGDPREPELPPLDREKQRISKHIRFVDAGVIYDHEIFENLLWQFVSMPQEYWEECAYLPDDTRLGSFCKFVDDKLIPVDFEPSPMAFMVRWDESVAEQKKKEMKPKYKELHSFLHEHHNRRITMC